MSEQQQVVELDADTAAVVGRLAEISAKIAEISAEAEGLKAELRNRLDSGTYALEGRPALKVTVARRFDPEAAYALVPEALRAECIVPQIDPAKVKSFLPPVVIESCMKPHGKPRVEVLL